MLAITDDKRRQLNINLRPAVGEGAVAYYNARGSFLYSVAEIAGIEFIDAGQGVSKVAILFDPLNRIETEGKGQHRAHFLTYRDASEAELIVEILRTYLSIEQETEPEIADHEIDIDYVGGE